MAPKKKSQPLAGQTSSEVEDLKAQLAEAKAKLADRITKHDTDGIALLRTMKERDAYKKAKEENDERFMRERDEARAELAEQKEWATNELNIASAQANAAVTDMTLQRDEAVSKMNGVFAELERKSKDLRAWEQDCKAARAEKEALIKEADDAASRIVELQAMIQQKLSPAETCREERAEGNGGCGTCTICCNELKAELFETKATLQKESAQWKADYEGACKLVADMHAAAVGEIRGPSVGPVEDVAAVRRKLLEIQKTSQVVTGFNGVMKEIQEERDRQDKKWGQQNHPDGTGHSAAKDQADAAKSACDHYAKIGQLTWMHILTEEMLEAFAETDPEKLIVELIQSAAVATAWAECIRRRQHGRTG